MREESKRTRRPFRWAIVLGLGAALAAGVSPVPEAAVQTPRPINVLVLLGEWFGDAYFPLAKEIEARGWTMKRIGLDGEYRGCYNKKRDVVLRSDIVIQDKMDLSGFDALIIPSGPQFRKFRENPSVLKFVRDAHAAGLLLASFCVGNNTIRDAGLIDNPDGPALFPEKVTRIKEGILIGPRGGGPPPGDGFESAPIKEVCDAVTRELAGKPDRAADNASGAKAPLSLTYVANMGVQVGSDGTKVLIDALFDKPNPEYRAPTPGTLEKIIKGEPPYDGVNLAFVTHNHPDHFAPGVAVRFLETQMDAILVAPSDAVSELRKAASDWTKLEPRVISLDLENGDFRRLKAAGIPITAVRTLHSGGGESPMNLMYLFEIGGRRVFHEGDSTGKPEVFKGFGLESAALDLAVVHYWFPLEPNMSKYLQEVFQPDHIALGHLPIRLEIDAPGKINMVRKYYKDIFLLLPGIQSVIIASATPQDILSAVQNCNTDIAALRTAHNFDDRFIVRKDEAQ
jgi:L-ascorbate metabolism protein UlaG (beta-lactamase superfamily)